MPAGASLFGKDGIDMGKITSVTVHAGHNKQGKIACGASDYIDESKEARIICRKVVKLLKKHGIKAYNCTVNNGTSQGDVLKKICRKCNSKNRQLDISIHFNASAHSVADGKTKGVEVWCIKNGGMRGAVAKAVCSRIAKIGFVNRGVKTTSGLYFLNNTSMPAILIEVCFVDDQDDAKLYKKNKDAVAQAIVKAVLNYNAT